MSPAILNDLCVTLYSQNRSVWRHQLEVPYLEELTILRIVSYLDICVYACAFVRESNREYVWQIASFKLRVHVERLKCVRRTFCHTRHRRKNRNRAGCDNLRECDRSGAISQKKKRVRQIATAPYQYTHGHMRALIVQETKYVYRTQYCEKTGETIMWMTGAHYGLVRDTINNTVHLIANCPFQVVSCNGEEEPCAPPYS